VGLSERCSTSEYALSPPSSILVEAERRAEAIVDTNARRLGVDRRTFVRSALGAAVSLYALAACSDEAGQKGGTYQVPEEATIDADAAAEALGGNHPVVDVQTHLLGEGGEGLATFLEGLIHVECDDPENPASCFTLESYMEKMFGMSDTTMAFLSPVPTLGNTDPLDAHYMYEIRNLVADICGDRIRQQGHAWPNVGDLDAALDALETEANTFDLVATKTYTHVGEGWKLDDSGDTRRIAGPFLDRMERLIAEGKLPPILHVHKGLNFQTGNPRFSTPDDIGPVAREHPDLNIVVFHSGHEPGVGEAAYDPNAQQQLGVDILLKSLEDNNIGPGGNVYAELGATWRLLMEDLGKATHVIGKLLKHVGPDRILWGTDSIWYGSPQNQIQAFRTFEMSQELQERFGYPALTDEVKEKIFWRNAARLYDLEVPLAPCDPREVEGARNQLRQRNGDSALGPRTPKQALRSFIAEHVFAFK
jgi:uncharacterized protein